MTPEEMQIIMETYEKACRSAQSSAKLCDLSKSAVSQSRDLVEEVRAFVQGPKGESK